VSVLVFPFNVTLRLLGCEQLNDDKPNDSIVGENWIDVSYCVFPNAFDGIDVSVELTRFIVFSLEHPLNT
jgi:hypothetical protein